MPPKFQQMIRQNMRKDYTDYKGWGIVLQPVFITVSFSTVKERSGWCEKKARAFDNSDLRDAHCILVFSSSFTSGIEWAG